MKIEDKIKDYNRKSHDVVVFGCGYGAGTIMWILITELHKLFG